MSGKDSGDKNWWLFLLLGSILGGGLIALVSSTGGNEIIAVDKLGRIMCEQQGLEYSHHEVIINNGRLPQIYCKTSNKIIDNILILE